jgi:hypothetical protein
MADRKGNLQLKEDRQSQWKSVKFLISEALSLTDMNASARERKVPTQI